MWGHSKCSVLSNQYAEMSSSKEKEEAGHSHGGKKNNLNTDFIPSRKLNQIGLYYLNIKHKTIKLLENHLGENLDDFRDDFVR